MANELLSTRTMQMRLLITITMPNDVAKHKNNTNETANHNNDAK